jgi:tetratricopeptide (TPR) repeat protein
MRGRGVWLGAALAAALGAAGTARASTPDELFAKANDAYEAGHYGEAAESYETILRYGVRDPRVYYNLGNARFKMGRLGLSILSYERALRLDPDDQDLRDNLEFARGRIRDRVPEPELPYPVQVVENGLDRISANQASALFLASYCGACGFLGALLAARGAGRRRLFAYLLGAAGLAVVATGSALAYKIRDDLVAHAIVLEEKVDVRSGPAGDNTSLFTVHEGTRVEVRNRLEGWYQVSLPNALSGWIPASSVEQV